MGRPSDDLQPSPVLQSPADELEAPILDSRLPRPTDFHFDLDVSDRETAMGDDPAADAGEHAPPPNLAARLYRNHVNNARRKSSATSSRRNSLSSVHSHASSLSHRRASAAGCQSNYIAQHLRRASIIESRKARLADRAAHVEQVRLRAALVKAAPRGSISNSEEKALAAQLAKEKYLAKVAAACAEEVARAKRVAEEVKERKLVEEARARLEMEERQVEAEKRRAEYQRNLQVRRARRADSVEKKLAVLDEVVDLDEEVVDDETSSTAKRTNALTEEETARRIQRVWRIYRRCAVVRRFTAIDLHSRSSSTSFEDMTALVADVSTIKATTAILTQLGLQDVDDENAALNSRTFLSIFMILGHPVAVLNNKNGAQEQDLMTKATELLTRFDATMQRLATWNGYTPNATERETLSQAYSAYTSAFAAWRLQDSSVLIEGMVASFVELDAIWQTVKDDTRGEVTNDYREGIRDNQVMLLSRIRKLAGPDRADFLIKKAIRESRRRRPKKRPAAEVRPRGMEIALPTSPESAEAAVNGVVPPTDARLLDSGDVTKLFTPMPSNRVLTHELAIDKDYRLEDSATMSELRTHLYRSICDSMRRGFEAGEGSVWTVSAAENVREKLLRMLKPGNVMYNLVDETLDLDDIRRQSKQGVFSYDGFFRFMASILPKLCAPFRDAEVKTLVGELEGDNDELGVMLEKLFKLLRMVDLLSLDYTNFMVMSAAPTLIREAAGYEQRMFAKDLESGVITLEKTKRWWRRSHAQLTAEVDRRDPEGVRRPEDRPSSHKIYASALVILATEPGVLDSDLVPETLIWDRERLQTIRVKVVRVAVIGAILLTAKNLLRRDSRSQWKAEASRLWQLLASEKYDAGAGTPAEPSTAQKAFAILETAHNMPTATKQQLAGTITRFFAQAASLAAPTTEGNGESFSTRFTDPVLKVLSARIRSHIASRLSASTASERVRAASGASEALAACGLPEFVAHLGAMVDTLEKVREVDWRAHGQWLEGIAREVGEGDV